MVLNSVIINPTHLEMLFYNVLSSFIFNFTLLFYYLYYFSVCFCKGKNFLHKFISICTLNFQFNQIGP